MAKAQKVRRTLNDALIEKYVEAGGGYCPYCGNERDPELEYSSIEVEGNGAYQQITCPKCGARWADSYGLVSIVELEKPNLTKRKGQRKHGAKK